MGRLGAAVALEVFAGQAKFCEQIIEQQARACADGAVDVAQLLPGHIAQGFDAQRVACCHHQALAALHEADNFVLPGFQQAAIGLLGFALRCYGQAHMKACHAAAAFV